VLGSEEKNFGHSSVLGKEPEGIGFLTQAVVAQLGKVEC